MGMAVVRQMLNFLSAHGYGRSEDSSLASNTLASTQFRFGSSAILSCVHQFSARASLSVSLLGGHFGLDSPSRVHGCIFFWVDSWRGNMGLFVRL